MTPQIYLIAPLDTEPQAFAARLAEVLAAADVAALLLPRAERGETAYKNLAKAVVPVAQAAGCAVLVEGDPGLVKLLGADGLHVSGPAKAVKDAVSALRPSLIVGAGPVSGRHEAMVLGEQDPDYLFFGPQAGPLDPATREVAQWWSQTMEIPAVLSDPQSPPESIDAAGCEFVALSDSIWAAGDKAAQTLAAYARALEAS